MKTRFSLLLTILIGALVLACTACGSADPLNNTSWYVVKAGGDTSLDAIYISISFYDGEFSGYDGCNRFGAPYTIEESDSINLTSGMMSVTTQGCIESGNTGAQRSLFYQGLRKAAFFELSGNTLTLYDRDRKETLVMARRTVHLMDPADLVGTDWILESLNDTPVPEGLEIGLFFSGSHEASGRAGNYNYWLMDYEAKGDMIRWGIHSARDGELADDLQRFALNYLDAIGAGTHQYNQTEDTLQLFTQKGDTLVYRR